MLDDYQIPAVALIGALLFAFVYLAVRVRSTRNLLWLLGIGCTELYALFFWRVTMSVHSPMAWPFQGTLPPSAPWMSIVGPTALMVASAFLLASLSPLSFRLGRRRILYIVPYIAPLVVYSILSNGLLPHPHGAQIWIYLLLAWSAIGVAFLWSLQDNVIPIWLSELVVFTAAVACAWFFDHGNIYWPLWIGISGNLLMMALLVLYTYRRLSPGVFFAVLGLLVWAIPPFMGVQGTAMDAFMISLARAWVLSKVMLAIGLLLLAMEDEIDANVLAGRRERTIRTELQSYADQHLTARSLAQFEQQSARICAMIAAESRFRRVALVLRQRSGRLSVVGSAGLDRATVGALDAVLDRMPSTALGQHLPKLADVAHDLDLAPWLVPGDDLARLRQTRFTAILMGDGEVDGAILLADPRASTPLSADDLLPLQILAERLRTARAQSFTLGRLIDAERSTGTSHLATRLVQQMHNPLTVILGYGSLLEESLPQGLERTATQAILLEARRMRSTIDRLTQLTRDQSERYTEFELGELLADVEQLHRADFLRESIEFSQQLDTGLPKLYGNQHRIRQVLMHLFDSALGAVQSNRVQTAKRILVQAMLHGDCVRLEMRYSGARLTHPERLLEALHTGSEADVATGIGLSLSAEILREYGGSITVRNMEPQGVLVTVDVPVRETPPRV